LHPLVVGHRPGGVAEVDDLLSLVNDARGLLDDALAHRAGARRDDDEAGTDEAP
jgi:hypothetical protein